MKKMKLCVFHLFVSQQYQNQFKCLADYSPVLWNFHKSINCNQWGCLGDEWEDGTMLVHASWLLVEGDALEQLVSLSTRPKESFKCQQLIHTTRKKPSILFLLLTQYLSRNCFQYRGPFFLAKKHKPFFHRG